MRAHAGVDAARSPLLACRGCADKDPSCRPAPGDRDLSLRLALRLATCCLAAALWAPTPVHGQADATPPAPPSGLVYADVPNDAGSAVELTWRRSPDDTLARGIVTGYRLERATSPGGPWNVVDSVDAGVTTHVDATVRRNVAYFYRVAAFGPGGTTMAGAAAGPAIGRSSWFFAQRGSVLVFLLGFFLLVLYHTYLAQSGRKPFVRRLPGIDAIEEAIGRATEMGRPVLYVPGIQDIDELQTVAGLMILESVAKITARYETPLRVPVSYPIPFTIAQEMVRSGHVDAGRPDSYDPDAVQFVSPEQFAYVAAITGIMMREKPAAHIFMGSFYGESLMLAETGFANGAIQVAGTANVHQLPFFVVACDYTLIGEEIFAASAYLTGDPRLVGGLKGADMLKLAIVAVVVGGCLLESFGIHALTSWMQTQ